MVGVPKTMDNDLSITDYCIGFDSAVSVVTEALDRLHTTATSHHRVMVCEVMGRDTGWVAVMGGLAGGADMIIIPEFSVTLDEVVAQLEVRRQGGSDFSIIVVAEGVEMDGLQSKDEAEGARDAFGHVQLSRRGVGETSRVASSKNAPDTRRAQQCSDTCSGAVRRLRMTAFGRRVSAPRHMTSSSRDSSAMMPVVTNGTVDVASIADVVAEQRRVPRELYELAQVFY